jgi:hypothetical protein
MRLARWGLILLLVAGLLLSACGGDDDGDSGDNGADEASVDAVGDLCVTVRAGKGGAWRVEVSHPADWYSAHGAFAGTLTVASSEAAASNFAEPGIVITLAPVNQAAEGRTAAEMLAANLGSDDTKQYSAIEAITVGELPAASVEISQDGQLAQVSLLIDASSLVADADGDWYISVTGIAQGEQPNLVADVLAIAETATLFESDGVPIDLVVTDECE